jgi:hypothetical protein
MQKYQSVVQYNTGVAVAGASVTVKNYPAGTVATIYSDNGITTTTNPITTDSTGRFSFYAADGRYSLEITGTSLTPYTVTDILLEDVTEPSTVWVQNIVMPGSGDAIHYTYSGSVGTYGWNDNVKELYATGPNQPSLNNSFGPYYHYEFSADTMNNVFANFHIVHDFALGTAISPHFHLMTNSNASGTVRIGFEWSTARRADDTGTTVFTTPATCYAELPIAANSAGKHFVAQSNDGIPALTDINVDSLIIVRIFRDAAHINDTFPDTIFGLTVDLHYQVARLYTPNRDPDFFA